MKLTRWIRMHEAGTRAARPLGLALLGQAVLAAAALGADLLKLCGSCGAGDAFHASVAAIGLGGYVVLLLLLRVRAWTLVYSGVFAAAGVHLSLAALMIAARSFCPICAAAAAVAVVAPAALLVHDRGAVRWITRTLVPAFLVFGFAAWTVTGWREARAEAERAEARDAARALLADARSTEAFPRVPSAVLHVFESEHCPYCREFRGGFAPRLAKDFPRLEIVYHPASGVPWVRRTPTFVLGGEVAFEGLPVDYRDLSEVVSRAHGTPTAAAR